LLNRFGKILIVQDVDTIDPILFPILRNDYVIQGDIMCNLAQFGRFQLWNFIFILGVRKLVRLGDKLVDWNDNFRLFLFSRSTGLVPSPQSNALVNTINFNTTQAGLSEQV
jgi:dynein heavy chain 2